MNSYKSKRIANIMDQREESAEVILPRVEHHLSRIHASAPVDISFTDTLGIPVHLTIRTSALNSVNFQNLKEWGHLDFFHIHSGKGLTTAQSRLSCIMEAIERYSASYHPLEGRIKIAAYEDLEREAIDPRTFFMPPGIEFSPHQPLVWYREIDLIKHETVSIPVDFILIDIPDSAYPFAGFEIKRLGFFFSNGLAAGASLEEALVSGICEVVERDAQYAIANEIEPLPTELVLKNDPDFDSWLALFEHNNLTLRAFFSCRTTGFYTAVVTSWDNHCRILVMGTASDPDLHVAIYKAIMELVQQRSFTFFREWKTRREYFPIVRYIRDRVPPESYETSVPGSFWTERCPGPVAIKDAGERYSRNLSSVLDTLSPKHQVTGIDLTHPQINVPVVRVLISGMKNGYLDYHPVISFIRKD
ncbi:MAG: YcaO-like family protein [Syntrophobacterales bacterium]|nr:YcaO-like family protein [Syntrophobacterales bacterium]